MAVVAVVGRRTADVSITGNMAGMFVTRRRPAGETRRGIEELACGRVAIAAAAQGIVLPGVELGVVAAVGAATVGISKCAGIVQCGGQVSATEVDRPVLVVGAARTGLGMAGHAPRSQWRSGMVGMHQPALVGISMRIAAGYMAGVAVGVRTELERTAPAAETATADHGVLEGVLSVSQAERSGMASLAVYCCAVIDEAHLVVELDASVAVLTDRRIGDVVVSGAAGLVGMTGVAVVGAVVAAVQLGVAAVALADAVDPGQVEVTVAVGALGAGAGGGGGAPAPLPCALVVVTVDQSAIRTAGRGRTGEITDGGDDGNFADSKCTGHMRRRRGGGMAGKTGA